VANATPNPDGAIINERIFNDCPSSTVTTVNDYPTLISIGDAGLDCTGFANLHNWHFAEGGSEAVFNNDAAFQYGVDLTIDGTGDGEAGIQIAPWWSQNVDGRFNVRTTDGEIACFGGRLPFKSFTGDDGVVYVKGTTIHLEVIYLPNGLSETDPATIEYIVEYGGTFSSGPLPFDMGNPDEDPPYGLWGMLNDARVGGYLQAFLRAGDPDAAITATWGTIEFDDLGATPVQETSWSTVKGMYR
jgi:hypothetical protein